MIDKEQYIAFLLATTMNHTCTHLANHVDDVSHDAVSDFLRTERLTAHDLWQVVRSVITDGPEACLIVDDSVQDKHYSRFIDLVKRQYSGAVGGLVRGIGVVNLVHSAGADGEYWPIDYRIYAPDADGRTKNDHFRAMVVRAVADKGIRAKTILFDSWYASVANLKLCHRLGLRFYTTLKSNRMISLNPSDGYVHLDELPWDAAALVHGLSVKLKELPFRVQLFKVVATNGRIDWVITSDPDSTLTTQAAHEQTGVRWQIEELHRGYKQLTGSERCQCRHPRSQRTHLACCYHAWVSLAVYARRTNQTLYQARNAQFDDYLRNALLHPVIPIFQGV